MRPLRECVARNGRLAAAAFAALLALPVLSHANTLVIQPSNQDAFIQKNQPNRITGTRNTRLRVEASPLNTKVKRALVQFPLGDIPPGSIVTSAVIGLYASLNGGSSTLINGVYRITEPWQENSVKWNNQPQFVTTPSATAIVGDGRGFKNFDVTADVQAAVNLCANDHGWLVKDVAETGSNLDIAYISQEERHPADVPNRPRLVVTFTPPACTKDADCADGNLCTTDEHCEAGVCVVHALSCDDGNPCTTDVCDCGQGCRLQPICNDGLSCTTDTCACTTNTCDPETLECTNTPNDAACVTDCSTGTCNSDPDNPDIDPNSGCIIETTEPSGTPCTDGNLCTSPDECDGAGACGSPVVCTPLDQCHDAGTCDTGTGICSDPPSSNVTPCNDGDACSQTDTCNGAGTCVGGNPVVCTPLDQCHDAGTCDTGTGVCSDPPSTNGTSPDCREDCGNCVDDDENGLVDRDDPACKQPFANGGGHGAGDPKFRGKPVLRCQKGIRSASARFMSQLRTRLQKCTDGVFLCLQQKPGDAVCLAKARTRCLKQTAALQLGPTSLDQRLGAKITKACGPKKPGLLPVVAGTDLCGETGLGFLHDVALCATPNSPALLTAVTTALAEEHRCRAMQLFATDVPRATELLTLGGVDLGSLPCVTPGAQGNSLGLGTTPAALKAVVGCQRGIGTAGARFVKQVLEAEQRCSEAVAQCLQTKPGDVKCLAKSQSVCRKVTSKLYTGAQSREMKLKATIARACGTTTPGKAPRVALADLRSQIGIGYDTLQVGCSALGVPGLTSIDDVSECLVREHVCRADQLLTSQTPRAHEFLAIGGAIGR